jgi:hypothetical protein
LQNRKALNVIACLDYHRHIAELVAAKNVAHIMGAVAHKTAQLDLYLAALR